jgi:hypothetical protein
VQNTIMCQMNLEIQNTVFRRNLESCNTKYGNVSEELRIPKAVSRRNLERCIAKYGNVSEKFRNAEYSLSQEFREL